MCRYAFRTAGSMAFGAPTILTTTVQRQQREPAVDSGKSANRIAIASPRLPASFLVSTSLKEICKQCLADPAAVDLNSQSWVPFFSQIQWPYHRYLLISILQQAKSFTWFHRRNLGIEPRVARVLPSKILRCFCAPSCSQDLWSCSQLPCFSHSKMPSFTSEGVGFCPAPLIAECDQKWSPENG